MVATLKLGQYLCGTRAALEDDYFRIPGRLRGSSVAVAIVIVRFLAVAAGYLKLSWVSFSEDRRTKTYLSRAKQTQTPLFQPYHQN